MSERVSWRAAVPFLGAEATLPHPLPRTLVDSSALYQTMKIAHINVTYTQTRGPYSRGIFETHPRVRRMQNSLPFDPPTLPSPGGYHAPSNMNLPSHVPLYTQNSMLSCHLVMLRQASQSYPLQAFSVAPAPALSPVGRPQITQPPTQAHLTLPPSDPTTDPRPRP